MTAKRAALLRAFRVGDNRAAAFAPLPAVFPGHAAPVVRLADDGARELVQAGWGFMLPQQGRAAKRVVNARADRVRTSPFWRGAFEARRCLVPVTSYSEPKGRQPAVWHWFALKGAEPRPLFAFAGLWQSWTGPLKPGAEPVTLDVFAILTTTPNDVVRPVHPSRMPVILGGDGAFSAWLEGRAREAFSLARPFPAERMRLVHTGEKRDAA